MAKLKKLRKKWWKGLSSAQRSKYIEKKVEVKRVIRLKRSLEKMRRYGDKYQCSECFHRKSKSCTDDMPNGCEDWFSGETGSVVV